MVVSRKPRARPRANVRRDDGARVVFTPSMPSVSAARAHTPLWPCRGLGQAMQNSPARPPRPLGRLRAGRTVTVVSPPDSSTGAFKRRTALGHGAAGAACTLPLRAIRLRFHPTGCAPPTSGAGGLGSRFRATAGVAMRCTTWPANTASPGFGFRAGPPPAPRARQGHGDAVAVRIASASAQVLASGTLGPLAMMEGRHPAHR